MKGGMFISDSAREQLNINLDKETFEKLKKEINQYNTSYLTKEQCFITKKYFRLNEGLFLSKKWISDALKKTIESAEKLWNEFKEEKMVVCKCGNKFKYTSPKENCPKCNNLINIKRYSKSIKLPATRKIAIRLYIKFLGG